MKKLFILFCIFLFDFYAYSQTPVDDQHWQLLFEDNFNSLDTSIWQVANNFDHYGEPQVYTNRSNNVYVSSGNLVLQVNKETYHCTDLNGWACNKEWYNYTSGWIETKSSYNVQYGYMESRIKLPYGYGFWPAYWTFVGAGVTNGHNAAEIDIFEMNGDLPSTNMGTNLHMYYCDCENHSCGCDFLNDQMCPSYNSAILCYGLDVDIASYANTYHTYAVEWNPSKIIWYVDGVIVRNFPNPGIIDPVRIILNLAITPWKLPNSTTPFPSMMYIDYVRVYQLKDGTSNTINACSYNFSTYDNQVKQSIKIGGSGCANSITSGSNITLRATDYIEINGEFTIPTGTTFYMDVNSK